MSEKSLHRILIIDDDKAVCASIGLLLKKQGYEQQHVNHPSEVLDRLDSFKPNLILLDMNFTIETSGRQGLALLKKIREYHPHISVILMTGWATVQLAVEGMKLGAKDFIAKPWDNKELMNSIKSIFQIYHNQNTNESNSFDQLGQSVDIQMVGSHPLFLDVIGMAKRVAPTEASVLILGESGTGKELLAEFIHTNSLRANNPFVKVNLGGISTSLFESEMFGHKKGSFTDAYSDREGRFTKANYGTIFLDEIGELAVENQVKLLRVLQEKSYEILGESQTKKSDFRVIAATNKDLEQMVLSGSFREDLFYRINLITLYLPALRERSSDISAMVIHFAKQVCALYQKELPYISSETLNWLCKQPYPGNIRELKNQVERAILLNFNKKELTINNFKAIQDKSSNPKSPIKMPEVGSISLDQMEEHMIKHALHFHNNNISKTANALGITRSSLYRRLEKYNIDHESQD